MHTDKPPLRTIQGDGQSLKDAATEQLIRWVITGDDAERVRLLALDRQVAPRGRLRLVGGPSSKDSA